MHVKKKLKKVMAAILSMSMIFGLMPLMPNTMTQVHAADAQTMYIGTSVIGNPTAPTNTTDGWKGSYVYFGTYNGSPVKYRVLASSTTVFGGTTMLLDCDSILHGCVFSDNGNTWASSSLRTYLNGTFLTSNFSAAEQYAIAKSTKKTAVIGDGSGYDHASGYVSLNGEKIFVLDLKEATRPSYGYTTVELGNVGNRKKTSGFWWTRSLWTGGKVGIVNTHGAIGDQFIDNGGVGVSPALNVKLSSVLFTSVVKGTAKATGAEYKLTLSDSAKTVNVSDNKETYINTKGQVRVPYTYTDTATESEKVNQISVMITDKAYTASGAKILYYDALTDIRDVDGNSSTITASTSGTGTFTLPDSLKGKTLGSDYYMYILAEHATGTNAPNYASSPCNITSMPTYTEIENLNVAFAQLEGGKELGTEITYNTEGINTVSLLWTDTDGAEATIAAYYPSKYKVNVTATHAKNYRFYDTKLIVNGSEVEYGRVINSNGSVVFTKEIESNKDKLISITHPDHIDVANGTPYENMHLPTKVNIVTEGETVTEVDVTWDTTSPASGSYDSSIKTEQQVTLNGTLTIPDTIDTNGVEPKTTIAITISAAGVTGAPEANHESGTYTENKSIELSSTTEGATIYYTTNGSEPSAESGTKYTGAISVTGTPDQSVVTTIKAIAVKSELQDSPVETFTYTIQLPHEHTYDTTAWTSDDDHHWHAATCEHTHQVQDKVTHEYGEWTSNNDATAESAGTKSRTCSVCSHKQTKPNASAADFSCNSNTGIVSAVLGDDIGTITTYYKVGANWTTTKPTLAGTYEVGIVTTESATYAPVGTAAEPFADSSWKYVVWGYTADGSKITANCGGNAVSITIQASEATYSDSAYSGVNLSGKDEWEQAGLAVPTIKYVGRGTTTYEESETAPANAGTYTAKITVEGQTASADFTIKKANSENISSDTFTKTGETIDGKHDAKIAGLSTVYEYSKDGGSTWTDCTDSEITNLAPGTVKIRIKETDNYNASNAVDVVLAKGSKKDTTTDAGSKKPAETENGTNNGDTGNNGNGSSGDNNNSSNGNNSTGDNNRGSGNKSNNSNKSNKSNTANTSSDKKTQENSKENTPENVQGNGQDDAQTNENGSQNVTEDSTSKSEKTDVTKGSETVKTEIKEKSEVSKTIQKELESAITEIKKIDSKIQEGPFIIPNISSKKSDGTSSSDGANNSDGTSGSDGAAITLQVEIPSDLQKENRVFYLMRVDAEGNVIILTGEISEDGTLTVAGNGSLDSDATYQIIYEDIEDEEIPLASFLGDKGQLLDADGNAVSVETTSQSNGFNWIPVVIAAIVVVVGFFFILLWKRRKEADEEK